MSDELHGPEFAPGPRNPKIAELERQLAEANERIAELAVSMISLKADLRKFAAEECSWAAVEYLDSLDHGECSAILASVRAEAKREERRRIADYIEQRASEPKWDPDVPHFANHIAENLRRAIAALKGCA